MNHKLDAVFDGTAAVTAIAAPLWLADAEAWGRALLIFGGVVLLVLRIVIALRALRHVPHGEGSRHE
ncbi:MAG TPA: hypothetical protein VG328_05095 [Stellaceae bacterium]|jgi:hypothetical protein|nr:hypothetical protein [Stellaceae bacterium]